MEYASKVRLNQNTRDYFELRGHTDEIQCVQFSPKGRLLATSSKDGSIRLWNIDGNRGYSILSEQNVDVNDFSFSTDGLMIASTPYDLTNTFIHLWDVKTEKYIRLFSSHTRRITSIAFIPEQKYILASTSQDGKVLLWNFRNFENAINTKLDFLCESSDYPQKLSFTSDGEILALLLKSGTIVIWDMNRRRKLFTLTNQKEVVKSLEFSPKGQLLLYGTQNNNVEVWDVKNKKHQNTFSGHQATVECAKFSPDGTKIASGSRDGTVKLWEFSTGNLLETLRASSSEETRYFINALDFSPDGTLLASATNSGEIFVWRI